MRLYKVLALIVLLAITSSEGRKGHRKPSASRKPIVGGNATTIDNFPYQVSLGGIRNRRDDDGSGEAIIEASHFCGGSIISVEWVLTAAHCLQRTDPDEIIVRVGSSEMDKGGYIHEVSEIINHENYGKEGMGMDFDIALIRVSKPFEYGDKVQPIALSTFPLLSGAMATVTGWGDVESGRGVGSDILMKVQVPIVPHWECQSLYGGEKITENMFCAGKVGKDSCQGDSGGPIVYRGRQIGVVSWGYGCGDAGFPGIYSDVRNMRGWIREHTGI